MFTLKRLGFLVTTPLVPPTKTKTATKHDYGKQKRPKANKPGTLAFLSSRRQDLSRILMSQIMMKKTT